MRSFDAFLIGGEPSRPSRAARIIVRDPANAEEVASVPRGTASDARAAVHAARWAFDEGPWPRMPAAERAVVIQRLGVEMALRRQELIEAAIHESGATGRTATDVLVGEPLDAITWYAARTARDDRTRLPDHPGASSLLVRRPSGVVGVIAAAAEPLACLTHGVVAALAAGNTVVVKAASQAPLGAFILAEAARAAQVPPGALNVISGPGRECGSEIAGNPMVDVVCTFGGPTTVRRVAQQAAARLATTIATAGASGTTIVCEGADVEAIVGRVVEDWMRHAGQAWAAACRVIVVRSLHDALADRLTHAAKGFTVGSSTDGTDVGPMRSVAACSRLEKMVSAAVADGATLSAGADRGEYAQGGAWLTPVVLTGVTPGMRIASVEIAGPALALIGAEDTDDALRLAASIDQRAAVHVWARDRNDAVRLAERVRAASVYAQGGGRNPWAPQGSAGATGLGRTGGTAGLDGLAETTHLSTPPL